VLVTFHRFHPILISAGKVGAYPGVALTAPSAVNKTKENSKLITTVKKFYGRDPRMGWKMTSTIIFHSFFVDEAGSNVIKPFLL